MMGDNDIQTVESVVAQPDQLVEQESQGSEVQEQVVETPAQETPDVDSLKREYESKLEDERRKAEFYRQMAMMGQASQQQQRQPEPEETFDSNYVPTGADVQNFVHREIQKSVAPIRNTQRDQMVRMEEELMRRNPDTQDYDDVIKTYSTDLFRKNPGLYDSIMSMPNAAQLAYNLGKSHPDYQKKQKAKTSQDLANTINSNLRKPASVVSQGGKSASSGAPDYANMSKDDLEREIRKVKGL
jgi:hypothetical protein